MGGSYQDLSGRSGRSGKSKSCQEASRILAPQQNANINYTNYALVVVGSK